VKGRFEPDTQAILRIYVGELTFNQILAVGRGDASRIDLVLQEGRNDFVVNDDTGVIRAERVH
jgi:hypothetical protein